MPQTQGLSTGWRGAGDQSWPQAGRAAGRCAKALSRLGPGPPVCAFPHRQTAPSAAQRLCAWFCSHNFVFFSLNVYKPVNLNPPCLSRKMTSSVL